MTAFPAMASAQPNTGIHVIVHGHTVEFDGPGPVIIDNRVLVPLRGVFEAMGFNVDWNDITSVVILTRDGDFVLIPIGSSIFTANGQSHTLDVPAQLIGGRTMLPIRAVLESVGYTLDWDNTDRRMTITAGHGQEPTQGQVQESTPELTYEPEPEPEPEPVVTRETPFLYTRSSITIPNRHMTSSEKQEWIDEYNANGGASAFELEVIRLVNAERVNYGLNSLEICHILMLASRFYVQTLSNLEAPLGHSEGPYGGSFETADAFGDRMVGIRAAVGTAGRWTPESVVQGWMDSPGHRANILSEGVTRTGTGFYLGGQWGVFGYQLFGGGPATPIPN